MMCIDLFRIWLSPFRENRHSSPKVHPHLNKRSSPPESVSYWRTDCSPKIPNLESSENLKQVGTPTLSIPQHELRTIILWVNYRRFSCKSFFPNSWGILFLDNPRKQLSQLSRQNELSSPILVRTLHLHVYQTSLLSPEAICLS